MLHRTLLMFCLSFTLAMLMACSAPETAEPGAPAADARQMPPGFLDDPPPPPTSNTQVLSGGTLVAETVTADSVVVIQDGRVVAWGKRGEVDMPNDSVGFDLRGKWITPGRWEDFTDGAPAPRALQHGAPANLLILRRPPPFTGLQESELGGRVVDGELEMFDA